MKKLLILLLVVSSIFLLSCESKSKGRMEEIDEIRKILKEEWIDLEQGHFKYDKRNEVFLFIPSDEAILTAITAENYKKSPIYEDFKLQLEKIAKTISRQYNKPYAFKFMNPEINQALFIARHTGIQEFTPFTSEQDQVAENRPQEETDKITAQIKKDHSNFIEVEYYEDIDMFVITPTSFEAIDAFSQENFRDTKIYKTLTEYARTLSERLYSDYNFSYIIAIDNPIDHNSFYFSIWGEGKDVVDIE